MTVSLPPDLYRLAMQVAKEEFRSKSELVREALRSYDSRKRLLHQARKQLSRSLRKKGIRPNFDSLMQFSGRAFCKTS
jgi:Arc/MetJ-type ribon-helix-helix transcriptional regulator